jgi:hypothetical protein
MMETSLSDKYLTSYWGKWIVFDEEDTFWKMVELVLSYYTRTLSRKDYPFLNPQTVNGDVWIDF